MASEVDVFVGNNTFIDFEVYRLWLKGFSAHEAACTRQQEGILQEFDATFDILLSDTLDQYRTFSMLEKSLKNPTTLIEQTLFQIDQVTLMQLIERYYEFDSEVIREILGKKLTARHRKDLDDVSDKTRVAIKSCRRQFDNVKRVFKLVEELLGSLIDNIKSHFRLSHTLAKRYAAVVFITNNRFETNKKRLAYLTFDDFAYCAIQMITNWSYSSQECKNHEDMDVDMDRKFLHDLRDVKILGTEKEYLEEHKSITLGDLSASLSERMLSDVDSNFKNMTKVLVSIGSNLNQSKEARDIFDDLVEKFIDPCRQAGWTHHDLDLFLQSYQDACHQLNMVKRNYPQILNFWDRYMKTLKDCILQMYHI